MDPQNELAMNAVGSDEETDWEEVQVPEAEQHLEITLQTGRKSKDTDTKKKGISHLERLLRIDCHKIHTVCLLANARIRNQWINDSLLYARLISLTPLSLQNSFAMIHKSRIPDPGQRGRQFEVAIMSLVEWWANDYFEVASEGHIRNRTFDEVQKGLAAEGIIRTPEISPEALTSTDEENDIFSNPMVIDAVALQDVLDDDGEVIRSSNSLMKRALVRNGSRDVSAQLFTALCRGLGIPARLIVSLQSVPWQAGIGKPKDSYPRKPKQNGKDKIQVDGDDVEVLSNPGTPVETTVALEDSNDKSKGKGKVKHPVKLRKSKFKAYTRSSSTAPSPGPSSMPLRPPDPLTSPPVFWTEVFSRADGRWIPVDPIRALVNKRKAFDPSPQISNAPSTTSNRESHPLFAAAASANRPKPTRTAPTKQENRMLYVIAFEEDGFARDVTRRYAREYGAKVSKAQGGTSIGGAKSRKMWWSQVLGTVTRPYRLQRDDAEDEELDANELNEGMPTTISGFKDHPLYVLTRHLKQNEVIYPSPPETPEIGKFRGEPVYPRSSVVTLKTAENWMRSEGRAIKPGSQALSWIKIRAGTIAKQREIEVLKERMDESSSVAGSGEVTQGMYARHQTELFIPPPVIDGKVPKNNFGNIDLYVPSMLPVGAVHIPFKGVAKIARKLGFDFGEAVIGFEFRKRRAYPITEGIVIASEHEQTVLEAYWHTEQEAETKARSQREKRVIKQWTRLVHGLLIRERLKKQYSSEARSQVNAVNGEPSSSSMKPSVQNPGPGSEALEGEHGAGFLVSADDVVERYQLPKDFHVVASYPPSKPECVIGDAIDISVANDEHYIPLSYGMETMDVDDEEILRLPSLTGEAQLNGANAGPKTLQELAAAEEEDLDTSAKVVGESNVMTIDVVPPVSSDVYQDDPEDSEEFRPAPRKTSGRGRKIVPPTQSRRTNSRPAVKAQRGGSAGASSVSRRASTRLQEKKQRRGSHRETMAESDEALESDDPDASDIGGSGESLRRSARASVAMTRVTPDTAQAVPTSARVLRPRKSRNVVGTA